MDAEYLKDNIGDVLASGLTSVFVSDPVDPVDYLARWLLNYVDTANKEAENEVQESKLRAADAVEEMEAEVKATKAAKQAESKQKAEEKDIADFEDYLNTATSMNGLLDNFAKHLQRVTKASAVYIGKKEQGEAAPVDEDAEEGEEAVSTDIIKYVAATEGQDFMLNNKLQGNQGLTHKVFVPDAPKEEEEEEADEEDEDAPKKVKEVEEVEDKSVFVPNVLLGEDSDKMHFWTLPNLGSYFAMHLPYEACLNEDTLSQASAKEAEILEAKKASEDEEGKAEEGGDAAEAEPAEAADEGDEGDEAAPKAEEEAKVEETEEERLAREEAEEKARREAEEAYLISMLPKEKIDYVVCLDTLNSGRLTDEQVAIAKRFIKLFKETLVRLDRTLFKKERLKRASYAELESSYDVPSEDDVEAEKQKIVIQMEKLGLPTTASDVAFKYRQQQCLSMTMMISEYKSYNVFRGPMRVLQALFYLLGAKKEDVADVDNKPLWSKLRSQFNDGLFTKIQNFDARAERKSESYSKISAIQKLVEGLNADELRQKNFALAELYGFVQDAIAVKIQAKKERIAAKKAQAEAEAAAARAIAEAESAEAGEEGAAEEAAEGDEE